MMMNWLKIKGDFIYFSPCVPLRSHPKNRMIPIVKIEELSVHIFEEETTIFEEDSALHSFLKKKIFFIEIKNKQQKNFKIGFFTQIERNHFARIVSSTNFINSQKNNLFFFPLVALPIALRMHSIFIFLAFKTTSNLPKIIIKSIICNYLYKQNEIDWFHHYPY